MAENQNLDDYLLDPRTFDLLQILDPPWATFEVATEVPRWGVFRDSGHLEIRLMRYCGFGVELVSYVHRNMHS